MHEDLQGLTMGHVCQQTGLSPTTVRTYIKQFNLYTARTESGHHRFSQEIIPTLLAIKEKLQQHGWTYQQVHSWLSKGEESAAEPAPKSPVALEDKLVHVSKKLDELAHLVQARIEANTASSAERFQQMRDFVITEQVKAGLRVEALKAWAELPEMKRTMRAGLFRRQEDIMKRETFIAVYIRERLEEQLERELGFRETAATLN